MFCFGLICVVFIWMIKKYRAIKKLFVTLYCMSENNKLHPLRELVLLVYETMFHSVIPYDVEKAEFSYTLRRDHQGKAYDVDYGIELNLFLPKWEFWYQSIIAVLLENRNTLPYSVYIIWDSLIPIKPSQCVNLSYNGEEPFPIEAKSVTLSLNDNLYECAGLYKAEIEIPISAFHKRGKGYGAVIHMEYCIESNFELSSNKENSREYNFVMIPINYGRRIRQCSLEIHAPADDRLVLACYRVNDEKKNPHVEKCIDFEQKQADGETVFSAIEKSFRPQKGKVYFLRIVAP